MVTIHSIIGNVTMTETLKMCAEGTFTKCATFKTCDPSTVFLPNKFKKPTI